jgi:hypothetical protein
MGVYWSSTSEKKIYRWRWVHLEKPPITQLLKNLSPFYGTQRFITMFKRALHWSLSWMRCIQSTPPHQISLRFIFMLPSNLVVPSFWLCQQNPVCIPLPPCVLHAFPSHPWLIILSTVYLAKSKSYEATIMQISSTSYYFILVWSKYSPQQPVLKYLNSVFFP